MPENLASGISESPRNQNHLSLSKGDTKENSYNNHKNFNYIEYYLRVVQRLTRDNLENKL
jgi:hypothetical protein